jgi:hypothetical protein
VKRSLEDACSQARNAALPVELDPMEIKKINLLATL